MNVLVEIGTWKRVREALNSLPEGLDAVYDNIMQRIGGQIPEHARLAKRALMWLVHTERPPTMVELQCAVTIETDDTSLDESDLYGSETLVAVCCRLILVEENTQIVRFAHYMV